MVADMIPVPGDCYSTPFGTCVVISQLGFGKSDDSDDHAVSVSATSTGTPRYKVYLWRRPSSSVASCSVGYFSRESLIERLPVAEGMEVVIKGESVCETTVTTSTTTSTTPVPLIPSRPVSSPSP